MLRRQRGWIIALVVDLLRSIRLQEVPLVLTHAPIAIRCGIHPLGSIVVEGWVTMRGMRPRRRQIGATRITLTVSLRLRPTTHMVHSAPPPATARRALVKVPSATSTLMVRDSARSTRALTVVGLGRANSDAYRMDDSIR